MSSYSQEDIEARLGHHFSDSSLPEIALTHPSTATGRHYQRLEFLGDRVLGLVIAAELYQKFGVEDEGLLTTRLHQLVRKETLAGIAETLDLADSVKIATSFSETSREREGVLADVMEALLGAVFLDGGYKAARAVIQKLWANQISEGVAARDPKSSLQEWLQGRGLPPPEYEIVGRTGPDHSPDFKVRASAGDYGFAEAQGSSKRKAEIEAAEKLLAHLYAAEDQNS